MPNPWDDIDLAGDWLLDLAEVHRPDLIHLNGYVHAALPWSAPAIVVAHSCVWSWWRAVHDRDPPAEWHRYRKALANGLAAADAIVAPSQAMLDSLDLYFESSPDVRDVRRPPGTVIYNGRDLAPPNVGGERSHLVFAAGRLWDEAKNIRVLDLAARDVQWPVYVAGEPIAPHGQEMELLHARTLGPLSSNEMQQWLARAAIYALPALYEPFGLSVLEAALQGCALVLGDIPSLREVWGDAAIFVSSRDPDQWAAELNRLSEDPERMREYAERAQLRAERYSRAAMTQGYDALYAELLAGRPHFAARSGVRQVQR
jgi:glycosyltransferase involved in cell wall biosynthesis